MLIYRIPLLSSITFPINECEHPTHTPSSNVLYVSHLGVQTLHNLDLSSYTFPLSHTS